jgi:hypothetical protein
VQSLREVQLALAGALFDEAIGVLPEWIRGDGLDPVARINIYRNNWREGFLKALALEFPVVERLVSEEYFRQLGERFLGRYPSRAGDLHHIGELFPGFVAVEFANGPYAYLADVARLEWACQESLVACDVAPADLTALRAVAAEELERVRFDLHPACRLVSSDYPIVRIWRANQDDRDGAEIIDLREGPDFVLVSRRGDGIELRSLPVADFSFARALSRGASLGESLQVAQAVAADFDPARALQHFAGLEILSAVHTA